VDERSLRGGNQLHIAASHAVGRNQQAGCHDGDQPQAPSLTRLGEQTGVETKAVKAVMAALELTILASVHKKGAREFTLPGLLKIGVIDVPAKKKRKGIDPFTGQEREFAAKPATVRIKVRALKKIKDAAL